MPKPQDKATGMPPGYRRWIMNEARAGRIYRTTDDARRAFVGNYVKQFTPKAPPAPQRPVVALPEPPPQANIPTLAQCIWLQNNFDSILKEATSETT